MNAQELHRLLDATKENTGYYANCPACNNNQHSLVFYELNGETLFKCKSGCSAESIEAGIELILSGKRKAKPNMEWIGNFTLSEAEVDKLIDPDWIYKDLIIQGHLIAIPAAPGAGKTTIMMQVAAEIAKDYKVCYVNADIGSGDVKAMQTMADYHGFSLLLPDMKVGLSMDDVVKKLEAMNQIDADYIDYVFIFDTLKKMADVINKTRAKELYKTLRGLTAKGMTIILLAHTNKYNDSDGHPIYEGCGDLRSDVDELIYLIPKKNPDGSMTVSTDPDKVRGKFEPITFEISADRIVTRSDYVDVQAIKQAENQREQDESIIEAITEAIQAGHGKQAEITGYCKGKYHMGWRTINRVLDEYRFPPAPLWKRARAFQNNAWVYTLTTPPLYVVKVKSGEGGEGGEGD
jgi:hypothetical protein